MKKKTRQLHFLKLANTKASKLGLVKKFRNHANYKNSNHGQAKRQSHAYHYEYTFS